MYGRGKISLDLPDIHAHLENEDGCPGSTFLLHLYEKNVDLQPKENTRLFTLFNHIVSEHPSSNVIYAPVFSPIQDSSEMCCVI